MKKIMESTIQQLFKVIGFFHSDKIIYFESFHGNQYSDNPKAIYEWLKNEYPSETLVWGVNKGSEKPFRDEEVSYVFRFSFKWFLTMPRAKAWVVNTRTPLWLTKNKKTMYIQTWHGTPLKKIGQDISNVAIPGYTKISYDQEFSEESARWDYLVSPNSYSSDIFRRAFDYQGPLLEVGYPRNDQLVEVSQKESIKEELKNKLKIPQDKQVILYAPTWRETAERTNGKYAFEMDFPMSEILEVLGAEVIVLVRMHYLVADQVNFRLYGEQVKNVSTNYDMSDLLAVSDLLITDYSSCLFDFSITNRPMLFFIPDQEEYEKEMRGFYFPMEDNVPGILAHSKEELLGSLTRWQARPESLKLKNYDVFKENFTKLEKSQASEKIGEMIVGKKECK